MNTDISQPFKTLGNQINSLPHIKLGENKPNSPDKPIFNPKEQDVLDKVKKWGIILAVTLVICYAVYRIFS